MATLYFSYGSNMSTDVMAEVCPRSRVIGVGRLGGYRLAFTRRSIKTGTGVADIVPDPFEDVWGVLYELGGGDGERLDRKEGCGWAYVRLPVAIWWRDQDAEAHAFTYTVKRKHLAGVPPAAEYLDVLVRSATVAGLPAPYIARLRETSTVDS